LSNMVNDMSFLRIRLADYSAAATETQQDSAT
jgi:hypothetical protein